MNRPQYCDTGGHGEHNELSFDPRGGYDYSSMILNIVFRASPNWDRLDSDLHRFHNPGRLLRERESIPQNVSDR